MCAMCIKLVAVWPSVCDGWERKKSKDEAVADAPDRDDFLAERAELLAQTGDMRIYGPVEAIISVAPDALDQELATERASRMRGEELEQLELFGSQVQLGAIEHGGVHRGI